MFVSDYWVSMELTSQKEAEGQVEVFFIHVLWEAFMLISSVQVHSIMEMSEWITEKYN